jgi:hypothetical protein
MLIKAFEFATQTNRPNLHNETRRKITLLAMEIERIYKEHMRRSTGKVCDICGAGDSDEIHLVQDCLSGYEHREHLSPVLCYNHACGWRQSYGSFSNKRKAEMLGHTPPRNHVDAWSNRLQIIRTVFDQPILSDEEIDLHFTRYLATQLLKEARKTKGETA